MVKGVWVCACVLCFSTCTPLNLFQCFLFLFCLLISIVIVINDCHWFYARRICRLICCRWCCIRNRKRHNLDRSIKTKKHKQSKILMLMVLIYQMISMMMMMIEKKCHLFICLWILSVFTCVCVCGVWMRGSLQNNYSKMEKNCVLCNQRKKEKKNLTAFLVGTSRILDHEHSNSKHIHDERFFHSTKRKKITIHTDT